MVHAHGDFVDRPLPSPAARLDSPQCDYCAVKAGPPCRMVPAYGAPPAAGISSPLCCCEATSNQHHCLSNHKHQSEQGVDSVALASPCYVCTCQACSNHYLPQHTHHHQQQQQQHHLPRHGGKADVIARSRSASSVSHDPKNCSHSDPFLSPVHTGNFIFLVWPSIYKRMMCMKDFIACLVNHHTFSSFHFKCFM